MKLVPLFQNGEDPDFNYEAAVEAYNWAVENPEEAVVLGKMLAFEDFVTLVDKNQDAIQEMIDLETIAKAIQLKEELKRTVIAKAQDGEEVDDLVEAGEEILKAFGDPIDAEERMRRQRQARTQWRGPGGQFRTMTVKIAPTTSADAVVNQPLGGAVASSLGIPKIGEDATREDKARFHNAWLQVSDALKSVEGLNETDVTVAYKYRDSSNNQAGVKLANSKKPELSPKKFIDGGDLEEIEIAVNPNLSAYGAAYDLLGNLVSPNVAGAAVTTTRQFGSAFPAYAQAVNQPLPSEIGTNVADYKRIGAASNLINATLGSQIGPAGRVATALGSWVGSHGHEAEQVLGPGARKASYRYRGVEKRPDPELQRQIDTQMKGITRGLVKAGVKQEQAQNAARDFLVYGPKSAFMTVTPDGRRRARSEIKESPLVERLANDLPDMKLANLQLASGHVPPSHGVIIDRQGNVVSQAVGYGDDWYLPFNLRTISMVNGGEYLRTRTLGGPTSEDIYTSLVTEARGFTVISHSGVFNVEYDKSFRGTRRFNDKAKRMVDRYEKLLDAVKSNEVAPRVPADRLAELRSEAADLYPNDPKQTQEYLTTLINNEKRFPKMSAEAKSKARDTWLNSTYGPTRLTSDGREMGYEDLRDEYTTRYVKDQMKKPAQEEFNWEAAAADLTGDAIRGQSIQELSDQMGAAPLTTGEKYQLASAGVKAAPKNRESLIAEAHSNFDADPIAALSITDPSIATKWATAEKNIDYTYAQNSSALQLDAEGYYSALKALQEQFPYYIKRVEYRPLSGQELYSGSADTGYVKPRYNRPAKAKASYYDRSILGQAKVGADKTAYQNYRVRQSLGASNAPEADTISETKGSLSQKAQAVREKQKINDSRWTMYAHLTAPNTHSLWADYGAGTETPNYIDFQSPRWETNLSASGAAQTPTLFGRLDQIAEMLPGENVPTNRASLKANAGRARTGPFTQAEFNELMNEVPGFGQLVMNDANTAAGTFRTQTNPTVSSVRKDLLSLGYKAPEGDNLPSWGANKFPDLALENPMQEFSFAEQSYRPNQKANVYSTEADTVIKRVKNFASSEGLDLDTSIMNPDVFGESPFKQPIFKDALDRDINSVTSKIDQGNEFQRMKLLQDLHRLRRLHSLYSSENLVGGTVDDFLKESTNLNKESGV